MIYSIKSVFETVLKYFGYEKKQVSHEDSEYNLSDEYNFTEIISNSVKNLVLSDRDIKIIGKTARAELLQGVLNELDNSLSKLTTQALGYGGVVVIPYVTQNKLTFDTAIHNIFYIDKMIGSEIIDCVVLADKIELKNSDVFTRFIRYELQDNQVVVTNIAMKGNQRVALASREEWKDIPDSYVLQGIDKTPLVYIPYLKDNKKSKQVYGLPITTGAEKQIKSLKDLIATIDNEYKFKKARIFVDKLLFRDDNGYRKLSDEYTTMTSDIGSKGMISEYSPDIRDTSYFNKFNRQLEMLEKSIGVSAGILTKTESRGATATEIKANMQDTYSVVSDVRRTLEYSIKRFIEICDYYANLYNLSQLGDYELSVEWSYSLIESSTETYNQLLQANDRGAISRSELRQYIYSTESKEVAEQRVKEIEEEQKPLVVTSDIGA